MWRQRCVRRATTTSTSFASPLTGLAPLQRHICALALFIWKVSLEAGLVSRVSSAKYAYRLVYLALLALLAPCLALLPTGSAACGPVTNTGALTMCFGRLVSSFSSRACSPHVYRLLASRRFFAPLLFLHRSALVSLDRLDLVPPSLLCFSLTLLSPRRPPRPYPCLPLLMPTSCLSSPLDVPPVIADRVRQQLREEMQVDGDSWDYVDARTAPFRARERLQVRRRGAGRHAAGVPCGM